MPPRVGARRANPGLNDAIPLGLAKHHSRLVRNGKREGHRDRCLHWLETLAPLKPNPAEILKRIAEVKAGLPLSATDTDPAPAEAPASKP